MSFLDGVTPHPTYLKKVESAMNARWHTYFFNLCLVNASMSKDPSTKVGAVIVRPDKTVASMGMNGFARGCDDHPSLYADRDTKYARIIHGEMNAILTAKEPLTGYTLYTYPMPPCERCAAHVIQSGIKHVIAPPSRRPIVGLSPAPTHGKCLTKQA